MPAVATDVANALPNLAASAVRSATPYGCDVTGHILATAQPVQSVGKTSNAQ